MEFNLQLFGGRGTNSGANKYYLPKNPYKSKRLKDITNSKKRELTKYRNFLDKDKNLEIEYHPAKQGEKGWRSKSHYHVKNPNSSGKHDYYLDKDGNPCPKGSDRSHLEPGEYETLLRRIKWN